MAATREDNSCVYSPNNGQVHFLYAFQERKNVTKLTEALERSKSESARDSELTQKFSRLEAQLKEATDKLAAQEVKVSLHRIIRL